MTTVSVATACQPSWLLLALGAQMYSKRCFQ
jgi:hypothetical protein